MLAIGWSLAASKALALKRSDAVTASIELGAPSPRVKEELRSVEVASSEDDEDAVGCGVLSLEDDDPSPKRFIAMLPCVRVGEERSGR